MNRRVVHVTAPSRLHFGMLSINRTGGRQFGGAGAMIATPGLKMTIRVGDRFEVAGLLADRTERIVRLLGGDNGLPRCRIEILQAPREHVGLGTGTQLSMAVVAGLNCLVGAPPLDAAELARRVGRGERSAIGLYGFIRGGLLFERGKTSDEEISPLAGREDLPDDWRFVLICPRRLTGLYGEAERQAFAVLPPVPEVRCATLERLAHEQLLPAAARADFESFSEALYEFGYQAGLSFAARQGGPFAGQRLTSLVALVRKLGIRGVGQSSWGPTLFALCPSQSGAQELIARLVRSTDTEDLDLTISPPDNKGARIEIAAD